MTLSEDKKYQITMSSWLRYIDRYTTDKTAIFIFLFGLNQSRRYSGCKGFSAAECGFLSYFLENETDFIFVPFINETLTTGTIVGDVYQTSDNTCTGTEAPASADDWQAECKQSDEAYQDARKDSVSQFTCQIDGEVDFDTGSSYTVKVEASSPWQLADCSPSLEAVAVQEGVNPAGPFYIWQGREAWLKTYDGDIAAQGSLAVSVAVDDYLADTDIADFPGVVSYNSGTPDFGEGYSSAEDWLAETATSPKGRTFGGFKTLLGDPPAEESAFTTLSSLSTGTYFYEGESISIGAGDNLTGGNRVVLLVDGDVTIDADLTVAEGDFLAIVASGTIAFGAEVAQAQGIFFTDGSITIAESETQFQGEGMFLADDGFSFNRDLEAAGNLEPAEVFTFRPDFLINSPSGLWITPRTWQEVAP